MSQTHMLDEPRTVLEWYDFICAFCYVGQQRNTILVRNRFHVIELPFQAHVVDFSSFVAGIRRPRIAALLVRHGRAMTTN